MKYKKIVTWVLACVIALSVTPARIFAEGIEDNLVASWNMEAANGIIGDASENNMHLTTSGTTSSTDGAVGGYSQFTGSQNAMCYSNDKLGGFEQFSLSLWIKRETLLDNGSDFIIDKDEILRLQYFNNSMTCVLATEQAGWYAKTICVDMDPVTGKWMHVALVYTGSSLKLYINGQQVGERTDITGKVKSNGQPLYISRLEQPNNNPGYVRDVDEVRLYDTALTEKDIKKLYREKTPDLPSNPNVIGEWNEVDADEAILIDATGRYNGILSDTDKITNERDIEGNNFMTFRGGTVCVPDSPELDKMDELSICGWVMLNDLPKNDGFILVGKDDGDASYRLRVHNSGALSFALATENNAWYSDGTVIGTKQTLVPGSWYYISAEYDGSNLFIYVNGELWAKSTTPISGKVKDSDSNLYFGSMACGEELFASLQNIGIYKAALSQEDLKAQYKAKKDAVVLMDCTVENGTMRDSNGHSVTTDGDPIYSEENGIGFISLDGEDDVIRMAEDNPGIMNNLRTLRLYAKIRLKEINSTMDGLFVRDDSASNISFHSFIDGSLVLAVKSGDAWYSGNFQRLSGNVLPEVGKWCDLELRYDKGQLTYYLNNVLIAEAFTGDGGAIASSSVPLTVGVMQNNYLKADFAKISVSKGFVADAEPLSDEYIGGEEILSDLRKEIKYEQLSELYIPNEGQFTYNLMFNINGELKKGDDFIISVENSPTGISVTDDNKLVIDKTAEPGNIKLKLAYKYDKSIINLMEIPVVEYTAPIAERVTISGTGRLNEPLKSEYAYSSNEFPAKSVEYYWARSTQINGEYTLISNAKTATYTVTDIDKNGYIRAGVKIVTDLQDYIEEGIPDEIKWSEPVAIREESRKTGSISGGGGGGSSSAKPSVPTQTDTDKDNNQSDNNKNPDNDENNTDKPLQGFKDIEGHWAYDDIVKLKEEGVIQGISEDEFAPEASVTRAEIAAMLVRALKLNDRDDSEFKDVEYSWYSDYVYKIATARIMEGSYGYFRPSDSITREELAKVADNVIKRNGKTIFKEYSLSVFTDSHEISSWAEEAISNVCGEGIMCGISDNRFAPKDNVTRAQMAAVINRLLK